MAEGRARRGQATGPVSASGTLWKYTEVGLCRGGVEERIVYTVLHHARRRAPRPREATRQRLCRTRSAA